MSACTVVYNKQKETKHTMKKYFSIPFILLLSLVLQCSRNTIPGNAVFIQGLDGYLEYYDWTFTDDPKLIGAVKKYVKDTDQTGIVKNSIDAVGIRFYLMERPLGSAVEFNNNMVLVVADISANPQMNSLGNYMAYSKMQASMLLKNFKMVSERYISTGGYDSCIMEYESTQQAGNKQYDLSYISMIILKGGKSYSLTGTSLQRDYHLIKPKFERILYSLKKQ